MVFRSYSICNRTLNVLRPTYGIKQVEDNIWNLASSRYQYPGNGFQTRSIRARCMREAAVSRLLNNKLDTRYTWCESTAKITDRCNSVNSMYRRTYASSCYWYTAVLEGTRNRLIPDAVSHEATVSGTVTITRNVQAAGSRQQESSSITCKPAIITTQQPAGFV